MTEVSYTNILAVATTACDPEQDTQNYVLLSGQALYRPSVTVTSLKLTSPVPSWKKLMSLEVSYHDLLKC